MPRRALLLLGAPLGCLACLWVFGYDLDQDGWPDSISLGRSDLHLVITRDDQVGASPDRFDDGRLYQMPPAYVHILLKKAFDWDTRWDVLKWDANTAVVEAVRVKDKARVTVHVDDWRGWARVRVSVREPGAASGREVAGTVFQCLETVLFYGIGTPRTVRGFAPR